MRLLVTRACILIVIVTAGACSRSSEERPPAAAVPPPATQARFVGAEACRSCHAKEASLWRGSHHERAMMPAGDQSIAAPFTGTSFSYGGVTSRFTRRGDQFIVRTDGPDGRLTDYPVAYTFGVDPLQQYLLPLPGGRLQALSIAWDTRPQAQGGQRWFHLYPSERVDSRDVLHWTGPAQNWNHMCAECHSTNLQKGYAADRGTFDTRWSEVSVSCEACHGPGSRLSLIHI